MKKNKKFTIKEGDTVYYDGPNGIEEDVAMMIDGHEITTADYGYLNTRDCLPSDDPRVVDYIKNKHNGD